MQLRWTAADIPDQAGRTALVTGANSGLGFQTSLELARRGARVLLGCRDPARGASAVRRIHAEVPAAQVELVDLDLSAQASVQRAAQDVGARVAVLDLLVANAGVMAVPRAVTADGYELQLATNHLGHFALVARLAEALHAAPSARVVVVSSEMHRIGRIDFADLMGERSYGRWSAYGQSKLANLLFVRELQRRSAGSRLLAVAAHPGYAATNLQTGQGNAVLQAALKAATALVAQPEAHGAWPQEYAATAPEVVGGGYYGPGAFGGLRGHPRPVTTARRAQDDAVARRLWDVSASLTGVGG